MIPTESFGIALTEYPLQLHHLGSEPTHFQIEKPLKTTLMHKEVHVFVEERMTLIPDSFRLAFHQRE
jgi:hypothetical protein